MKALLIGGTGTISLPISKQLIDQGWELTILNRGSAKELLPRAEAITADMAHITLVKEKLKGRYFDVVAQFIAYTPQQVQRDIELFDGMCGQYIFISSASAYHKPPRYPFVRESTPLFNPFWEYSRNKAACEDVLMTAYRDQDFPVTIVRPSHTFSQAGLPFAVHGKTGPYSVISRILQEKPVVIAGDGTNLWTVTWSEDFAKGFIGLMGNVHALGEAFHITSDEALSWNQIYQTVSSLLDRPFKPCYVPSHMLAQVKNTDWRGGLLGDKANCALFDNSKIKSFVPGFLCPTRFDQAARISLDYILDHESLQKPDPSFDIFSDEAAAFMEKAGEAFAAMSLS
ncbi:MAG: NAD-dependent epimerase/dehydratase family protein [Clostridiales bacterium]|nr:NAD-dependent epimerase/dehydratase family protein [Clostridiales bacterium]